MVEYRAVPDDELDAFRRVLDYAFRASAGPAPDHEDDPPWIGERRGLYDDGTLVTTAVHLPFEVAVRGRWLDIAGMSAVATRPEDRRRGLVRRLLVESLAEYRDRGLPFSLLWPFKHSFYRRFGWGRLAPLGRYEFEPSALEALSDHPLTGGGFERLVADEDAPALRALDDRFARQADLTMRRTEAWYRHRFFESWQGDPFVYGWLHEGELGGYLRYIVEESGDDERLVVLEFGAPDDAAAVNLLRLLYRHADQVDEVQLFAPPDERLFDLVEEPRDIELSLRPGPMGRLVDVAAGLEALPVPDGVEGTLAVAVDDPLVDGNDGEFALEAADGAVAVAPGAGDGPRASLPVETLSRLAFGATTVARAAATGGLAAEEPARRLLAELFPPREVYLREFF